MTLDSDALFAGAGAGSGVRASSVPSCDGPPFGWRRGDVLLVDNVLAPRARGPYAGDRRLVGEPVPRGDVTLEDDLEIGTI